MGLMRFLAPTSLTGGSVDGCQEGVWVGVVAGGGGATRAVVHADSARR